MKYSKSGGILRSRGIQGWLLIEDLWYMQFQFLLQKWIKHLSWNYHLNLDLLVNCVLISIKIVVTISQGCLLGFSLNDMAQNALQWEWGFASFPNGSCRNGNCWGLPLQIAQFIKIHFLPHLQSFMWEWNWTSFVVKL